MNLKTEVKMMQVPWANPWLDEEEKRELIETFDSTWLSMGPRTKAFEERMREYIGVKHAIAVSNGTVALDLALKGMHIGPGDEVIVPAMTFIATVSAVLYQNAVPVFADIELDTYNIDPASIEKLITKKTKCIVYIDYGGNPADHDALRNISKKYKIPLLHDAAQSLGGSYQGQRLCKQGLVATTSFHTAKLMTTIEGGMIFTEDDGIAAHLRMMRNQGEDPQQKYIHKVLGTNARMTDLQAAIGLKQMDKFLAILKRRKEIAEFYYSKFSASKHIKLPLVRAGAVSAWFFAPILIENRDAVARQLNEVGIATRIAYPMPAYEQPFFDTYRDKNRIYDCPNAKWMTQRVLNLPLFHQITEDQLNYVVDHVLKTVEKNAK